jgi:hypothetical protein
VRSAVTSACLAAQLARNRSASAAGLSGSAVYVMITRPSPASSMASPASSMSPTRELWSRLGAVRWCLTLLRAQRVRNSSLLVANSPDEVCEAPVVGIAACFASQCGDRVVRDGLPVEEERWGALVEEEEPGEVQRQFVPVEEAVVEGEGQVVGGEDVHAGVADVGRRVQRFEDAQYAWADLGDRCAA